MIAQNSIVIHGSEKSSKMTAEKVRLKNLQGEHEVIWITEMGCLFKGDGIPGGHNYQIFKNCHWYSGGTAILAPLEHVEGYVAPPKSEGPANPPPCPYQPKPEFRDVAEANPDFIFHESSGNFHLVQRWRKAGCAVIPIARYSLHGHLPRFGFKKTPPGLQWGHWKQRPMWDREVAQYWTGPRFHGIGVPCGAVSGGLEDTEFDCHVTYLAFKEKIAEERPELWAKLPVIISPTNGRHLPYRCEKVSGNMKLAQEVVLDDQGNIVLDESGNPKFRTLIETRGEGGMFVAPGSPLDVHPCGLPYVFERGCPEAIPTITAEEREYLHSLSRSFNKYTPPPKPKKDRVAGEDDSDGGGGDYDDLDEPWNDFNARADWEFVFDETGYQIHPCGTKVTRPGKSVSEGSSASLGYLGLPIMHVFSSSMSGGFEPEGNYTKFATWAILKHGGDFSAAGKAAIDLGYGRHGREWREALEWGKSFEERLGRWEKLQQEKLREAAGSVIKYKDNALFSYLWRGHHRRLSDEDRYKRMCSTVRALKLLPATGFFPEYLKSQLPCSDCPAIYHVASALVMAGHLLNRKVKMPFGTSTIYPNIWAGVLGPSSVFHKSYAVNSVKRVMPRVPGYEYTTLPDSFTFEAMVGRLGWVLKKDDEVESDPEFFGGCDQIAQELPITARKKLWCERQERAAAEDGKDFLQGVGLFHLNEIGGWLATLGNNQNLSAKETLTHLYDCPGEWEKATVTNGVYYIYRPCLSILGASTVNWLQDNLTESDIQGGFLPRWLFFNAKAKDYIMAIPDEPDPEQQEAAFEAARRLSRMRGTVRLGDDEEATDLYWGWRQAIEKQTDPMVLSWANRMGTYALKVAMIFEASVAQGETISSISPTSMRAAITLIDYLMADLRGILQDMAFDKSGQNLNKIKNYIKLAGKDGIGHSTILKKSKLDKNTFANLVGTLAETGEIALVPDGEMAPNGKQPMKYVYVTAA